MQIILSFFLLSTSGGDLLTETILSILTDYFLI